LRALQAFAMRDTVRRKATHGAPLSNSGDYKTLMPGAEALDASAQTACQAAELMWKGGAALGISLHERVSHRAARRFRCDMPDGNFAIIRTPVRRSYVRAGRRGVISHGAAARCAVALTAPAGISEGDPPACSYGVAVQALFLNLSWRTVTI